MSNWSSWTFYYNCNQIVYSRKIQYPSGLLYGIEPYTVLSLSDIELSEKLKLLLRTSNVDKVSRKYREEDKLLADQRKFLGLMKVRSERELARKTNLITVERNFDRFNIEFMIGKANGSFEGDTEKSAAVPKSMNLEECVAVLMQEFRKNLTSD
jgi:hypothetical protein